MFQKTYKRGHILVSPLNLGEKMANRNNYLVNSSLKKYLLASIITMAVMNLNGLIDGVLMGWILGSDALAAIQNSMPVISGIAAINQLLTGGAAVIISKALGRRDYGESNRSMTIAFVCNLVAGVLIALFSGLLSQSLASLLSIDKSLVDYTRQYIFILFIGSVFLMFQNGMSVIVDVSGGPKTVTASMITSVVANLFFDILLVKIFSLGIMGAALATVLGAFFSVIIFILFFIRKKTELKLKVDFSFFGKTLLQNIIRGIPPLVSTLAVTIMTLICNLFVQSALGKSGMFTITIGFNMISLGSMIGSGVGMAFLGIGGMLVGEKDYAGLRMLFKRGIIISLSSAVVFNLLAWLIPDSLAMLFGAKDDSLIAMTHFALPIICIFLFAMTFISPIASIYQITEHTAFATIASLSLIIAQATGFVVASAFFPAEWIWIAFPISTVLSLGFVVLGSAVIRHKINPKPSRITLIPSEQTNVKRLDISVECAKKGIDESSDAVAAFLSENVSGELLNNIRHCVDELLLNYVDHSGRKAKHFTDLCIAADKNEICVIVKDDGVPFDPIHCEEGKTKAGLKIFQTYAQNADYRYSFGQNITSMKFPISEDVENKQEEKD